VASLDHHLVPNSRAGGVKLDALLAGECLDRGVLRQVGRRLVLHVVIQNDDAAGWIGERSRPHREETLVHRGGVVVGHQPLRPEPHNVSGARRAPQRSAARVRLDDGFDERARHGAEYRREYGAVG
jgi:hypothetical protein